VASSAALTLGYWKDPVNTQDVLRDGGIHMGDLAWCDDDGFYWFRGRSKDLIIRCGSNISPGEFEDALYSHPAVYEAAVVGVRDPECGPRTDRLRSSPAEGCDRQGAAQGTARTSSGRRTAAGDLVRAC
jgi:acyl-CoA synthetase (AMP-forming)/AMP-acid ligase II